MISLARQVFAMVADFKGPVGGLEIQSYFNQEVSDAFFKLEWELTVHEEETTKELIRHGYLIRIIPHMIPNTTLKSPDPSDLYTREIRVIAPGGKTLVFHDSAPRRIPQKKP